METITEAVAAAKSALLTNKEAAEYLGLNEGTLSIWRSTGRYDLPFIKLGRHVRYRKSDLDAWLSRRTLTIAPPLHKQEAV